jgi:hypothetical protein
MRSVVSEESHRQQRERQESREDGHQMEMLEDHVKLMTMQRGCQDPSDDSQKSARRTGEATQVTVTALESQTEKDEEVPIPAQVVVAVAEEDLCPGFEIAWEGRIGGMIRFSFSTY